ncbi:acetoacetate--CoA ligase [Streptomyces sp. NPDC096132]|uniref:acetoacetate--CoA ligase n=1 Tax=Streptomyces sp. NPDC096132 TaxID=3366075 RepID=UPI00380496EA
MTDQELLWEPSDDVIDASNLTRFTEWLRTHRGIRVDDYQQLWQWSIRDLEGFWGSLWEFFDINASAPPSAVLTDRTMPGATWFPGARLNYAEHVFRAADPERPALVAVDENGHRTDWSWAELRDRTAALAAHLRALGVRPGDRVVGYLPNIPHAVVAFLATASVGAVWSSCGQDFAATSVLDRFAQLEPVVLVTADGYLHGGRRQDRRSAIGDLRRGLPTLRETVLVDNLGLPYDLTGGTAGWDEATGGEAEPIFAPVPFDHPLWTLFSSGTTGRPKGIVHGHGGILLEHLKFTALHLDLRPADRFLWYTTTSWMVWNVLVSGLLTGATIVLYDGSPAHPRTGRLWQVADACEVSLLGVSAGYLLACEKNGVRPSADHKLAALRSVNSTGSPLPESGFWWVHDHVGATVPVVSVSGGTDMCSAFVGGAPWLPVRAGEIPAPCLGAAVAAWDEAGQPVLDQVGELVITEPMPSMPLHFWNDDGARYRDAYFGTYPGVWRQGDRITVASHGGVVVHGRSDATLNRMGVRLGSAEIYQAVESLPEVHEALVVGVEEPDGGYWMPMFVALAPDLRLDDALRARMADAIRTQASPRHVPDEIIQVPAVPHTLTGKRLEVPVKRILLGTPTVSAVDEGSVDRPELLALYAELAAERRGRGGRDQATPPRRNGSHS